MHYRDGNGNDAAKTLVPGAKVRNIFGQVLTVEARSRYGAQVFVAEECNGWHHPSKLFPIEPAPTPVLCVRCGGVWDHFYPCY